MNAGSLVAYGTNVTLKPVAGGVVEFAARGKTLKLTTGGCLVHADHGAALTGGGAEVVEEIPGGMSALLVDRLI